MRPHERPENERPKPIARIKRGTFASVIRGYMTSPEFRQLAASTQAGYGRALRRAEDPELLGAIEMYMMCPEITEAYLEGLADFPGRVSGARTALRAVQTWAMGQKLISLPFVADIRVVKPKGVKGEIYFIEMGEFIKIGFSTEANGRIGAIGFASPYPIMILHVMPGSRSDERALHKRFKQARERREWFRKAPELLAYIEELKRGES